MIYFHYLFYYLIIPKIYISQNHQSSIFYLLMIIIKDNHIDISVYKNSLAQCLLQADAFILHKMSQLDSPDFDKVSQYSVASDFQFHSPIPLPKNPNLIPTNNQINQSLNHIESSFPDLPVDKVVNMLYNNLIAPKVPSEKSFSQNGSVRSHHSNTDNSSNYKQSCETSKAYSSSCAADSFKMLNKIKGQSKKETKKERKPKGQHEQNIRKAKEWDTQSNKEFHFNQIGDEASSNNNSQEVTLDDQKLVAKAFCQYGYGLSQLKDYVWDQTETVLPMNYETYVRVLKVVISQSYRRLQKFLIEDCNKNIKPLSIVQIRALFAILSNIHTKFQEEESFTFRKFMKITYDIESVSIFEQAAVKLFIKIQVSLRGRIGVRLKLHRSLASQLRSRKEMLRSPGRYQNQRFQSQSIWTAQLQADLVETIAQHRTIAKTRDIMAIKYNNHIVLANVKELKARFFKILRTSIKRLVKYAKEYAHKVPLLVDIIDQRIKIIMRSPDAVDARIALGRLYKTKSPSAEMLTEVITLVNQFYFQEEARREKMVRHRQPCIGSVTDKIKHNISISRRMLRNVTTPAQRAGENAQLVFLKDQKDSYQHIVSLQHEDKLHYFRKTGIVNNKGGFQFQEKSPFLKKLQLEDGDDDSNMPVLLSDQDDNSQEEETKQK